MAFMQFLDHLIPYDTFLNDVAAKVVSMMKADHDDPDYISQRKAYEIFGRRNVDRWRKSGLIQPCKRPGRLNIKLPNFVFSSARNKTTSRNDMN